MAGRARLRAKVRRYKPEVVAMVGVTVFRAMFPERKGAVALGLQDERLGESAVFVLPNPSGRTRILCETPCGVTQGGSAKRT